jgi:hypothetical protein
MSRWQSLTAFRWHNGQQMTCVFSIPQILLIRMCPLPFFLALKSLNLFWNSFCNLHLFYTGCRKKNLQIGAWKIWYLVLVSCTASFELNKKNKNFFFITQGVIKCRRPVLYITQITSLAKKTFFSKWQPEKLKVMILLKRFFNIACNWEHTFVQYFYVYLMYDYPMQYSVPGCAMQCCLEHLISVLFTVFLIVFCINCVFILYLLLYLYSSVFLQFCYFVFNSHSSILKLFNYLTIHTVLYSRTVFINYNTAWNL